MRQVWFVFNKAVSLNKIKTMVHFTTIYLPSRSTLGFSHFSIWCLAIFCPPACDSKIHHWTPHWRMPSFLTYFSRTEERGVILEDAQKRFYHQNVKGVARSWPIQTQVTRRHHKQLDLCTRMLFQLFAIWLIACMIAYLVTLHHGVNCIMWSHIWINKIQQ